MLWSFVWTLLQKLGPLTAAGAVGLAIWGGVERVQLAFAHNEAKQAVADQKLLQTQKAICDANLQKEVGVAKQQAADLEALAKSSNAKLHVLNQAAADSRSARASAAAAAAAIQKLQATGARVCPAIDTLISQAAK